MKTTIRNLQTTQIVNRMDNNRKKIIFELTEHDASMLLSLIKRELVEEDRVWQPYWRRLINNLEDSIQNANLNPFQRFDKAG